MRIAAIDCGSNSFHLLIADVHGQNQLVVIEDDKSLLHLGAEVAKNKELSHSSLLRARRVIRHYKTLIERHNVDAIRCVATSAIRSATNGDEFITALSHTLGHPIRVISGELEAQLIYRAISSISNLPDDNILAADMGGGSLEMMIGFQSTLNYETSLPLGASRIAEELNVSKPITLEQTQAVIDLCRVQFDDLFQQYKNNPFTYFVVSSGTLTTLATMTRAYFDGYLSGELSGIVASNDEVLSTIDLILSSDQASINTMLGYDKDRSDYFVVACIIAKELSQLLTPDAKWVVSPYALREGVVFTLADKHDNNDIDTAQIASKTIDDLENRMRLFTPAKLLPRDNSQSKLIDHCKHVEKLSLELFDVLNPLHNLESSERTLLSYACRLHDIGETINHEKHDQHGAYILSNIALAGFSPDDASALRGMVRWHRSRDPKLKDNLVGSLSEENFNRINWLTAILRIADGADSGKTQAIDSFNISIQTDYIFIRCHSNSDCELDMYGARQKRKLLERISQHDVIIEPALAPGEQD